MKIPLSWLKDYVDITLSVEELAERLTLAGLEVAAIERTSKLASRVETAMYLATEPKPGQLSVTGRSLSTVFGTPTPRSS